MKKTNHTKRVGKKTIIAFSRLNGTGVQKMVFTELNPDKHLYLEGEEYYILYKKTGGRETYAKKF